MKITSLPSERARRKIYRFFLNFPFLISGVYIEIGSNKKSFSKLFLKMINMSTTKMDSIKQYLVGLLIVSVIGGFSILLGDFAGWYYYNYYSGSILREWGFIEVNLESILSFNLEGILSAIILVFCAFLLFYVSYISYQALTEPQMEGFPEKIQYGIYSSIISLAILLAGGIIFALVLIIEGDSDWWFDIGFYGGIIGSGLTLGLLNLIKKEISNK